jgi:hypothetical protein
LGAAANRPSDECGRAAIGAVWLIFVVWMALKKRYSEFQLALINRRPPAAHRCRLMATRTRICGSWSGESLGGGSAALLMFAFVLPLASDAAARSLGHGHRGIHLVGRGRAHGDREDL